MFWNRMDLEVYRTGGKPMTNGRGKGGMILGLSKQNMHSQHHKNTNTNKRILWAIVCQNIGQSERNGQIPRNT